jgi:hypothetical protein
MTVTHKKKRKNADDMFRCLIRGGEVLPVLMKVFSSCKKFTPLSEDQIPWDNVPGLGYNGEDISFYSIFVRAATELKIIEYDKNLGYRWKPEKELTQEQKSLLNKKFIEITKNDYWNDK